MEIEYVGSRLENITIIWPDVSLTVESTLVLTFHV